MTTNADTEFAAIAGGICAVFNSNPGASRAALKTSFDKAGINYTDPSIAMKAAQAGNVDVLKALHKAGINLGTVKNEDNCSPIHMAAQNGHADVIAYLWEAGVAAHTKTTAKGFTPAHFAAYAGHEKVVEFLCGRNSELLAEPDRDGNTLVHWAAAENHVEVLKYALKKNSSLARSKNNAGETPLAFSTRTPKASTEAVLYLQQFESYKPQPETPGK